MWMHERPFWTQFTWDPAKISPLLSAITNHLGELSGRMEQYPDEIQEEMALKVICDDVVYSSSIEGETLNTIRNPQARPVVR